MRISTAKEQKTLDKFIASWKVITRNNRDWPAMHDISRQKHGIRFFRRVRTPHATWNVWVHLVHHQLTLSGSESYIKNASKQRVMMPEPSMSRLSNKCVVARRMLPMPRRKQQNIVHSSPRKPRFSLNQHPQVPSAEQLRLPGFCPSAPRDP